MTTYVDSSVLLRRVLGEQDSLDSEWLRLRPVSSALIRVECLRAIERYRMMGAIDDETVTLRRQAVLETLAGFEIIEPTGAVLDRAADPFPVYVATLHAIHLATAVEARYAVPDLDFATHDIKLGGAAMSLGFAVIGI